MFRRNRRCAIISGALVALWGHSITSKGFDMSNLSYRAGNSSALSPLHPGGGYGGGVGPLLRQAMENYSPLLQDAMKETEERKQRGLGKSPVPRIALKLGLQATRFNPYVRFAHMAFDAYHGLQDPSPWAQQEPDQEGEWDLTGWIHACGPPFPAPHPACGGIAVKYVPSAYNDKLAKQLCGTPGQVPTGDMGSPNTYKNETMMIGPYTPLGSPSCQSRMNHESGYYRQYLSSAPWTPTKTDPVPGRAWPLPAPSPKPASVVEEYPTERRPDPKLQRKYERLPYRVPAGSVQFFARPGPAGKGPPRDDDHILRPPGRNEREKKGDFTPRQALKFAGALYDAGTEAGDIIDVLWDNMKCKPPFRPGRPYGMSDKANYIYNNLDCLDLRGAVFGLIKNHWEDRYIYGKIFGTLGKHSPYGSLGPSHGGWIAR